MRLEVSIPDPLFKGVQQAATVSGVSLEAYVAKALELHLRVGALTLTPDQATIVRSAQEDVKAGRVMSTDEARAHLDTHKREWRAARPS